MTRRTLLLALVAALALTACSGDDDATSAPSTTLAQATTTTTTVPDVGLTVTRAELVSDSAVRGDLTDPLRAEVARVVEEFLDATSLTPLLTGSTAPGIDRLVTPEVGSQIGGADRALMIDDGLPRPRRVEVVRADVGLTGLGGAVEPVQLVVARFRLELRGEGADGSVVADVARSGELTLVPGDGGWRIADYEVTVTRDVPPSSSPSPSASTPVGTG
jgi:hypothetical protein